VNISLKIEVKKLFGVNEWFFCEERECCYSSL